MLSFLPHLSVLVPRSRAIPGGLEPAVPSEGELERCSGRRGAPPAAAAIPALAGGGCRLHRGSTCNWHQHRHRGLTAEPGSTAVTPCCRVVQDGQRRCLLWLDVSYSCPSPGGLSSTRGREGRRHECWDGYGALGPELDPFKLWGEGSLPTRRGDAVLGQPWLSQPWCRVSQERGGTQRDPCNVPRPPPELTSTRHFLVRGSAAPSVLLFAPLFSHPGHPPAPSHPLSRHFSFLLLSPPQIPKKNGGQEGREGAGLCPLSSREG